MRILQHRSESDRNLPRVTAAEVPWNAFVRVGNFVETARLAAERNIQWFPGGDQITFVPILANRAGKNKNVHIMHWTLLVIRWTPQEGGQVRLILYDPVGEYDSVAVQVADRWQAFMIVRSWVVRGTGIDQDTKGWVWTRNLVQIPNVPIEDSGALICLYAESISRGAPFVNDVSQMPLMREQIANTIRNFAANRNLLRKCILVYLPLAISKSIP